MFVRHYYFSDKRTLCFVFECNVNDKRTLCLSFIVTSVISARSVLYLIVTLVMNIVTVSDMPTVCFVLYC